MSQHIDQEILVRVNDCPEATPYLKSLLSPDDLAACHRKSLGRWRAAPTAGPYETEITPRQARNVIRMIELVRQLGTYPLPGDV